MKTQRIFVEFFRNPAALKKVLNPLLENGWVVLTDSIQTRTDANWHDIETKEPTQLFFLCILEKNTPDPDPIGAIKL